MALSAALCPPEADPIERLHEQLTVLAGSFAPEAAIGNLRRLSGGAMQETWAFDTNISDVRRSCVLRRARPGAMQHPSVAGFDMEVAAIRIAAAHGVPVPHIRHKLRPQDGMGQGFISDMIEGETVPRRILNDPGLAATRPLLPAVFGSILADLHGITAKQAPQLRTIGICTSIGWLASALDADPVPRPVFEYALDWLRRNAPPEPDQPRMVHGDFRLGNLIVVPGRIAAVLDWELVHLGDPVEDLAWLCLPPWRFGNLEKPVAGLGDIMSLTTAYERAGGDAVAPDRLFWWTIFGSARWGVNCSEMLARYRTNDPGIERGMIARRVSESEIDLLASLDHASAHV